MGKNKRLEAILDLIEKENIGTQEELTEALRKVGFDVSQGTVSRDIKELKLVKLSVNGQIRYTSMAAKQLATEDRLMPVLKNAFVSADFAGNLVVVKTLQVMAQAFCASIDTIDLPYVVGTLAGDDTVLVICKTDENAKEFVRLLTKMTR